MTAALLTAPSTGPLPPSATATPAQDAANPQSTAPDFAAQLAALLKGVSTKAKPAGSPRQPGNDRDAANLTLAAAVLVPIPPPPLTGGDGSDEDGAPAPAAEAGTAPSGHASDPLPPLLEQSLPDPPQEKLRISAEEGADPAQGRSELAFAARLTESGPPSPPEPPTSSAAPSTAPGGTGSPSAAGTPAAAAAKLPEAKPQPDPSNAVSSRQDADGETASSGLKPRSEAPASQPHRPSPAEPASNETPDSKERGAPGDAGTARESGIPTTAAVTPSSTAAPAAPGHARAEQTAAPVQAPPEAPREQHRESAVRELSLAIPGSGSAGERAEQVSLRVVERSGEVQVAVHTPDAQLAGSLREHLGELVSELAGRGYRTETWQPLAASAPGGEISRAGAASADSGPTQDFAGQAGDGSRNPWSSAGQQQQQQRQGQDGQPAWLEALARSTARTGRTTYDYTH